jgi:hypothetical protein
MIRFMIFAALLGVAASTAAQQDRGAALDRAYEAVLTARKQLQEAEDRRLAGIEPLPGERLGIAGGGTRLGPEYFARQEKLAKDVGEARARLDEAYRRWNDVR